MRYLLYTKSIVLGAMALGLSLCSPVQADVARDYLSIVGSSTIYPFAAMVAEQIGKHGNFKTPKVESIGTGGGIKIFCQGIGAAYPDLANTSRRMKKSEFDDCQKAGVTDIAELKIGFDGIVLAYSKESKVRYRLTAKELYLALAKQVPDPSSPESGVLVKNPYQSWNEINPALPKTKIEVLGPPPTSGTRDVFDEMVLEGGCESFAWLRAMKHEDNGFFQRACMTIREDGAYIEAGENDNLIVQKIELRPTMIGIFGYSYLEQNMDKVTAAEVNEVAPSYDSIYRGKYPLSRPLYLYVKKGHIGFIRGILEYITEFTSDKASGEEGYLVDKGLIPLSAEERNKTKADAKQLKSISIQS